MDDGGGSMREKGGLRLEVVRHEATVTVFASGHLDVSAADLLGDEVAGHLHDPSVDTVLVDGASLIFVDSTGLGVLVRSRRLGDEQGTAFRVRRPAVRLADLLERCGLAPLLLEP